MFQYFNLTKEDYVERGNQFGNTTDMSNAGGKKIYNEVFGKIC